ncbi:hypothetical protein AOL_s00081g49 [Orbilia oligospora ATCC 24927]|uniref:Uncharacterized protein n=1 Tax=Arthrobotrys oligospora (strain ATCC 24927 / CBS 115.81 / DSM 1491) TaxID=756982 RepID=G1XFA8_ARTOA|nr:hypothetical protein AOL_s00081g49 [Orbilia oligospora ATCC 24927]EGX48186.1 hypothetical protein AOL_s00081g49 [Orbilia oligospora ATCC 24927]
MAQSSRVILRMSFEEEDYPSNLKAVQESRGDITKASVESIVETESTADSCEVYRGSDDGFQCESCYHRPSHWTYEVEPIVMMHKKHDLIGRPEGLSFAPCKCSNKPRVGNYGDEDKSLEGNRPGVSVPLETWLQEKEHVGPNVIFKGLETVSGGAELGLDSLSLSSNEPEAVVDADEALLDGNTVSTGTLGIKNKLRIQSHLPNENEEIPIDLEEEFCGTTANFIFLANLSARFACPFAKLDLAAYRTCMIVNRGDVSGIRDHLEKRHGLQNLPRFDYKVDPSTYWEGLFTSVLSHDQEQYIEPQHHSPYFDFSTLLQDASDLRRTKRNGVTIDKRDCAPLPSEDKNGLLWISADQKLDLHSRYSANNSDDLSALVVLDYLSAVLISDEAAKRWLATESQHLASYTQYGINTGTRSGAKEQHNKGPPASNSCSSGAAVSSKKSRQKRSEKKKQYRLLRYVGDRGSGDEDDEKAPEKRKPQSGTSRYLKKLWRCPYSIIRCENHKKCWLDRRGEIMRQDVAGIREHLTRAHFQNNLPKDLTADFAPTWKDLFEGCLKESCHENWSSLGFHATWYRYIDECTVPSNKAKRNISSDQAKCYTPQQASALIAAGLAHIDDPEIFKCPGAGGLENATYLKDDNFEPEALFVGNFDEEVGARNNFSQVEESVSFGELEPVLNTHTLADSQDSVPRYDIGQQPGYSLLEENWSIPQKIGPQEHSMIPTQAADAVKTEADTINPQPVGISAILEGAVEQSRVTQSQNSTVLSPPRLGKRPANTPHKANSNDDNLRNEILAPQTGDLEMVIKVRHRPAVDTEGALAVRTMKFRSLEELRSGFVGRMRKQFHGSSFDWAHPRWQLQGLKTGARVSCIQDLEEELTRGNNMYYLVDYDQANAKETRTSGSSREAPIATSTSMVRVCRTSRQSPRHGVDVGIPES